jgi:hypothetical protein
MNLDERLEQQLTQAEARERDARAAELRLQSMELPPGSVKPRGYGELPQVAGLTAQALVARQDPALAHLLGLAVPRPSYEQQEAAEARQQQIQRMQQATADARAVNQQAQRQREQQQLAGVNPITGRRWGQ